MVLTTDTQTLLAALSVSEAQEADNNFPITKKYKLFETLQALATGLLSVSETGTYKDPVVVAGTMPDTPVYSVGTDGSRLLTNSANKKITVDATDLLVGERFLCTDNTEFGGFWEVVTKGSGSVKWVAKRPADYDSDADVTEGALCVVQNGTSANKVFELTTTTPLVLDTDAQQWALATSAPSLHATTHVTGGTDVIANAIAGGAAGLMSGADKTKLDGISAGAKTDVESETTVKSNAVATTNVGVGDAGKLFKLDAAGKAAGRVLEVDGAKLDKLGLVKTANAAAGDRVTSTVAGATATFATKKSWVATALLVDDEIKLTAFGTFPTGANGATFSLQVRFGGTVIGTATGTLNVADNDTWFIEATLKIVSATTFTGFARIKSGVSGAGTYNDVWGVTIDGVCNDIATLGNDLDIQAIHAGADGDTCDLNGFFVDVQ